MTDYLDQVRASCRAVAARARFVRIDEARLVPYAASLPLERLAVPQLDQQHHFVGRPDETVAFFMTLDAINFGSGFFPHLRKRPGLSGYFTVASSLTDYYRTRGPLSAAELARLTAADCARIFGQDGNAGPAQELMGLFATALNDLGRYLLDRFDGRFDNLAAAADGSAARLVGLLTEMPFFCDLGRYDGLEVAFYKRAQLTAADLALALGGEGRGRFHDLDRLTIFADNLVPHVLRVDGVLRYDPGLAARIDAEEPIEAHSPEEIEIRACAVHAVELLAAELRRGGHAIVPMQLDYVLWNRGQQPEYKAIPRHRGRTVFY